jgi:hypothetical protein
LLSRSYCFEPASEAAEGAEKERDSHLTGKEIELISNHDQSGIGEGGGRTLIILISRDLNRSASTGRVGEADDDGSTSVEKSDLPILTKRPVDGIVAVDRVHHGMRGPACG